MEEDKSKKHFMQHTLLCGSLESSLWGIKIGNPLKTLLPLNMEGANFHCNFILLKYLF